LGAVESSRGARPRHVERGDLYLLILAGSFYVVGYWTTQMATADQTRSPFAYFQPPENHRQCVPVMGHPVAVNDCGQIAFVSGSEIRYLSPSLFHVPARVCGSPRMGWLFLRHPDFHHTLRKASLSGVATKVVLAKEMSMVFSQPLQFPEVMFGLDFFNRANRRDHLKVPAA